MIFAILVSSSTTYAEPPRPKGEAIVDSWPLFNDVSEFSTGCALTRTNIPVNVIVDYGPIHDVLTAAEYYRFSYAITDPDTQYPYIGLPQPQLQDEILRGFVDSFNNSHLKGIRYNPEVSQMRVERVGMWNDAGQWKEMYLLAPTYQSMPEKWGGTKSIQPLIPDRCQIANTGTTAKNFTLGEVMNQCDDLTTKENGEGLGRPTAEGRLWASVTLQAGESISFREYLLRYTANHDVKWVFGCSEAPVWGSYSLIPTHTKRYCKLQMGSSQIAQTEGFKLVSDSDDRLRRFASGCQWNSSSFPTP